MVQLNVVLQIHFCVPVVMKCSDGKFAQKTDNLEKNRDAGDRKIGIGKPDFYQKSFRKQFLYLIELHKVVYKINATLLRVRGMNQLFKHAETMIYIL